MYFTWHFWYSLPSRDQSVSDPSAGGQDTSPAWLAEHSKRSIIVLKIHHLIQFDEYDSKFSASHQDTHKTSHSCKPVRVFFSRRPCHACHHCQEPPCQEVEVHTDGRQAYAKAKSWPRHVFSIWQWLLFYQCFPFYHGSTLQAVQGVGVSPCVCVDSSEPVE